MDAVEGGQSFTVTRDGHEIGELIPLRRRRRFVARDEFVAMSRNAAIVDIDAFRPSSEQGIHDEHAERARRMNVLQRAEHEFDPIPFGVEAARIYGRVTASAVGPSF